MKPSQSRFALSIAALLVFGGAGCSDLLGPDGARGAIQTDLTEYEAEVVQMLGHLPVYGFTVTATYRNMTTRTMRLGRCPPQTRPTFGVAIVEADGPFSAYTPVTSCTAEAFDILIAPGESRTDVLELHGPWVRDGVTKQPVGSLEGQFRLVYSVCGNSRCTAQQLHVSNSFTVVVAGDAESGLYSRDSPTSAFGDAARSRTDISGEQQGSSRR